MRRGDVEIADRVVMLGVVAAYAAGALIMLSVLIATSLWPSVVASL